MLKNLFDLSFRCYYENGNKYCVMEFDVNGNLIVDETYDENGARV